MLNAALSIAAKGKPVFPCNTDKRPYTEHGFKDATTDEEQIKQWWTQHPDALIGMPTGEVSDIVVLDVDNKNGHDGDNSLYQLEKQHGKLPETPLVLTPSGGSHVYFNYPDVPIKSSASGIGDGLDIRGDGGYVIVPPSKPNGKAYEWEGSNPDHIADMPEWLIEQTKKQQTVSKSASPITDNDMTKARSALQFIPNQNRDMWLLMGMALHSTDHEQAFSVWDSWGQSCDKYDAKDSRRVWNSFNNGGVSIGTLFYYAQQNGWAWLHTGKFALTDMGNAERLVNSCGYVIRYCPEIKSWLIWNGQYWEINTDGGINRLVKGVVRNIYTEAQQAEDDTLRKAIGAHACKSESKERVNAMIQMASTESGVPMSILMLDNDPWLLNVANGAIDLRTGELRPHQKTDMMTGLLPFNYDPDATCPKWGKFLSDIFNGETELIKYIQRAIGYTLTGNVSEQVMFFLYGSGANGKTTFLNVLSYLLGRHCTRITVQVLTQKPDNNTYAALAGIKNARGVIASEVEEGQRMAESLVKDMTGGEKISARELYGKFFEYMPTHKLWQYGNHKPQIRGTDDGIWRRIHLIPFTQSFRGKAKVKDMDKLLMQEIEGILTWAVEGCLHWQEHGLGMPEAVKQAVAEYRQAEDVIGHFIDECITKNVYVDTRTSEAYRAYRAWALENGYAPKGKKRFIEQMIDHGYIRKHKDTGDHWLGIRISPVAGLAN